jgi:excisionase family DNA binding protein
VAQALYSIDQVARRLGLHVRTVRGYVRQGRLRAVRIGKQYRIAQEDLEALTGRREAPAQEERVGPERRVEASSIVEIDPIDKEGAIRVANALMGAAGGHGGDDQPLRLETVYDEGRGRLKVVVLGGLAATTQLFRLIEALVEPQA